MNTKKKEIKTPISHEKIYRIMQWLPVLVTGLFFVKNIVAKNQTGMITIGICLASFVAMLLIMRGINLAIEKREFVLSVSLLFLIFLVSLNSGESYSDDFSLFLTVIGMSGAYLNPKITRVQYVISDILLIAMYCIHPEKAESLSQYILCMAVFTLAAVMFTIVIKRGQSFIEVSKVRAEEAEQLLESIRNMGARLQEDFEASSNQIAEGTAGLQEGSRTIARGSNEVSESCNDVRDKLRETQSQIEELNKEVRVFESALMENQSNVENMSLEMKEVGGIIGESGAVFKSMEEQMKKIASIAKEINDISFNLTILSLNAAVESARAGEAGAGFSVVASNMRELSQNSDMFSEQVTEVVKELLHQVDATEQRVSGSQKALAHSEGTMEELQNSFEQLKNQFETLYSNIEEQNYNINQIDSIFNDLNGQVYDMRNSSEENQKAVETIVDAMAVYRENIKKVVENTQSI